MARGIVHGRQVLHDAVRVVRRGRARAVRELRVLGQQRRRRGHDARPHPEGYVEIIEMGNVTGVDDRGRDARLRRADLLRSLTERVG